MCAVLLCQVKHPTRLSSSCAAVRQLAAGAGTPRCGRFLGAVHAAVCGVATCLRCGWEAAAGQRLTSSEQLRCGWRAGHAVELCHSMLCAATCSAACPATPPLCYSKLCAAALCAVAPATSVEAPSGLLAAQGAALMLLLPPLLLLAQVLVHHEAWAQAAHSRLAAEEGITATSTGLHNLKGILHPTELFSCTYISEGAARLTRPDGMHRMVVVLGRQSGVGPAGMLGSEWGCGGSGRGCLPVGRVGRQGAAEVAAAAACRCVLGSAAGRAAAQPGL
jgi:hypothetical protein